MDDDLVDSLETFEDFEEYKREACQCMAEYMSKFDKKYNEILKLQMQLPSAILAFMLLKKANITKAERRLVFTGMDYSQKDELYNQAKRSLLKFKGEQGGGAESSCSGANPAITFLPAFITETEEAYWNTGFVHRGSWGNRGGGRPWRGSRRTRGGNRNSYGKF